MTISFTWAHFPQAIILKGVRWYLAYPILITVIRRRGVPEKSTIDGRAAHKAAIERDNVDHGTTITIRQVKHLNNIVEQDHRAVQRVTRPALGFKAFHVAHRTLMGIARMHMLKKTARGRCGKRGPYCGRTVLLLGPLVRS